MNPYSLTFIIWSELLPQFTSHFVYADKIFYDMYFNWRGESLGMTGKRFWSLTIHPKYFNLSLDQVWRC